MLFRLLIPNSLRTGKPARGERVRAIRRALRKGSHEVLVPIPPKTVEEAWGENRYAIQIQFLTWTATLVPPARKGKPGHPKGPSGNPELAQRAPPPNLSPGTW